MSSERAGAPSELPTDEPSWGSTTLATDLAELEDAPPPPDRCYLVVFERDTSSLFELPPSGAIIVGRGEQADLRLSSSAVSRQHARLVLDGGGVRLADLGSQNGTFLNGQCLEGERALHSGDTITIGTFTLAFHSSSRVQRGDREPRPFLDLGAFRQRAEEELERSLRYGRPLTVLSIALPEGCDLGRLERTLGGQLRLLDVVAWGGADHVLMLLPESDEAAARSAAARLLRILEGVAPRSRIGLATCPADGCDLESLLGRAHKSASAPPGSLPGASGTLQIGQRTVVVADPVMGRLYALVERLAAAELPVLLCGETGTGKELAAQALHHWSPRRAAPFVAINCAAMQESLVESELFGHERGAFSGAVAVKAGLVEAAHGGTLFLDEIGELPLPAQAKLLRVLETRRLVRVGDVRERAVDVRVVAATNRNLQEEVESGRFRRDLYFRLSGATIWLPPLRDRAREVPVLARTFLDAACARAGRPTLVLSDGALERLEAHDWPGNVRELRHLMDYLAAAHPELRVEAWHIEEQLGRRTPAPPAALTPGTPTPTPVPAPAPTAQAFRPIDEELRALERSRMAEALEAAGGNQSLAAALIGMPRRTFVAKLKEYDLRRPAPTAAKG